jgi:AraC family transcriptional regulator of adaptative response / DNA-3-methyladenine glycosylase II
VQSPESGARAAYARALDARDPRFDGLFYVGITTTRVYCRPVCPSRPAADEHRRYFDSAAAAERAGFRPCLRCRPELAPGRATVDVVSRLAEAALQRIAAGALNGRRVADLAHDLGVSERHLRRAIERTMGVSPLDLALTQRLLLAKRLLADTDLTVTRIAYASGFQSLRRFNAVFRDRYGMPPSVVRTEPRPPRTARETTADEAEQLCLTLTYRAPFAWDALLDRLAADVLPGVDVVTATGYASTVRIGEQRGVVVAHGGDGHVAVRVSASLLPVLMPLLAGLRHLFDLDAEPAAVDAHLAHAGLSALTARRPGLRVPGALDGFDAALRVLLGGGGRRATLARRRRVVAALGEPLATGRPGVTHVAPSAARLAGAAPHLAALGVPPRRAAALAAVARAVAMRTLQLEPGRDPVATRRALSELTGLRESIVTEIVMRALHWPDGFASGDAALARAAGVASARDLRGAAERWRPWRAYAVAHLRLALTDDRAAPPGRLRAG